VAEMFAVQHPDKVAGLVLVDPSEMPTESRLRQAFLLGLGAVQLRTFALVSQLGFFRTRAGRSLIRRMAPADISKRGARLALPCVELPAGSMAVGGQPATTWPSRARDGGGPTHTATARYSGPGGRSATSDRLSARVCRAR
jgi:pimeloyl-ACP methyl ester carboxylesterase